MSVDNIKTILGIVAVILGAGIWMGTLQSKVNSLNPDAIKEAQAEALRSISEQRERGASGGKPQTTGLASVPIGTIIPFAGPIEDLPEGWLPCHGEELQVAGNEALYAAIGTTWGGREDVYFKVPDLRGEFLRGVDHKRKVDEGRQLGEPQPDSIKKHSHELPYEVLVHVKDPHGSWTGAGGKSNNSVDKPRTTVAGDHDTETRPRNVAVNFLIRAR